MFGEQCWPVSPGPYINVFSGDLYGKQKYIYIYGKFGESKYSGLFEPCLGMKRAMTVA